MLTDLTARAARDQTAGDHEAHERATAATVIDMPRAAARISSVGAHDAVSDSLGLCRIAGAP